MNWTKVEDKKEVVVKEFIMTIEEEDRVLDMIDGWYEELIIELSGSYDE